MTSRRDCMRSMRSGSEARLIGSQSFHGIDSGGAVRRNAACAKRNDNEQHCDSRESRGIGRADVK